MIITDSVVKGSSSDTNLFEIKLGILASRKELKKLPLLCTINLESDMGELPKGLQIRSIAYCDKPGKEKVIVIFEDNTKVIKAMCPGDHFDLNIGVALAFMEKLYGTKSQYHKMIQKKLPQAKKTSTEAKKK